jgi:hypothetical protein
LLSAGVVALILLTTWGGTTYAWGSFPIIAMGIAAWLLIAGFCWSNACAEPIIPLGLFRNRSFNVSAVGFVIGFTMFGAIIYMPLYLQIVHGATPTSPDWSSCRWWAACSSPSSERPARLADRALQDLPHRRTRR